MKNLIEVNDVSFEYNTEQPVQVLHSITQNIKDGEFVAILGHNGSGKSTFAKLLNGILQPTKGTVIVDGINTNNDELIFDVRQCVGMVFQNPDNQIVAAIVEEDVAFALENLGVEPAEIRRRVDDALKLVSMSDYAKHAPHKLSGGQKQRVSIAGIIAMRPKCIVLDEPTAMLDPMGRAEVLSTIKALNRDYNTTVVYITHFMDEAVEASRVIVMDNGKIILDDKPREVFSNVKLLNEVGLDVPQVTMLAYRLRKSGVNIKTDILTVDELVAELQRILN